MSLKNFHFRVFLNLSLTSLLKYYFIFFATVIFKKSNSSQDELVLFIMQLE